MVGESDPDPAERDQPRSRSIDAATAELTARQHGVVAHRQLLELGLSSSAIGRRAARGALHRVHRGVYAVGHPAVSLQGRWMAAVLSAGDAAVLSHQTAAALHGLLPAAGPPIHVTARKRKPGEPGILVHGSSLPGDERTARDGIPVTEPMRTLVDLTAVLSPHRLQRAADLARVGEPARRRRLEVLGDRGERQPAGAGGQHPRADHGSPLRAGRLVADPAARGRARRLGIARAPHGARRSKRTPSPLSGIRMQLAGAAAPAWAHLRALRRDLHADELLGAQVALDLEHGVEGRDRDRELVGVGLAGGQPL